MFRNRSVEEEKNREVKGFPNVIPKGVLIHLSTDQVKPNPNNPRRLFDQGPLSELKESIRTHGVLVPITVYKLPGQDLYAIVDGERRYRCCLELHQESVNIQIPANIVDAPDKMASVIYMFNIHAFREQWELMPTALSINEVIEELKVVDSTQLHEITGLSIPQIERCKKILSFPKNFQELSLDPDPSERIPSNFWVELHPILDKAQELIPDLYADLGRDGITQKMVDKYKAKKIKSVIHFRRIMEAIEVSEVDEGGRQSVADRLREFILTPELEIRKAFDAFIQDTRKVQQTIGTCDKFINDLEKSKIHYAIDGKDEIVAKLLEVISFTQKLLDKLQGVEPPEDVDNVDEENTTTA